ncbi:MAG: transcription antitermination factor NusB [Myxococcales bacterium]|nr:transcription antitermination factor NusB [Myxococcales bacterium]USN51078.1 MAG: transcription antitermination factor NusB [Myxococcales bacterium]
MKDRRTAREIAMQVLFQWEAQGQLSQSKISDIKPTDIEYFLGQFLHNFYYKDKSKVDIKFSAQLIFGTLHSLKEIDNILNKTSSKWKLSRMDSIDRAILRLACYELLFQKQLSMRIIINEAIEIAKRYGSEQSSSFINGILNTLYELNN